MATVTEIVDLPIDLYRLIVLHLDPKDWVHCLNVSTLWRTTFSHPSLVWEFLNLHFPQAREVRQLRERAEGDLIYGKNPDSSTSPTPSSASPPPAPSPHVPFPAASPNLARILCTLTKRYHHLRAGRPSSTTPFALAASTTSPAWCRHVPVAPWDRRLQYKTHRMPFHHPSPLWAYDAGLLAFPSADRGGYVLFDLAARSWSPLAIAAPGMIVRRLSMTDRVVLVEWARADQPADWCPHAHYATFFDVLPGAVAGEWTAQFRNEINIDKGGLPLNSRARFFSAHSRTHYAVYIWHLLIVRGANGRMLKEEGLHIYDISAPCKFRPSEHRVGGMTCCEGDGGGGGMSDGGGPHVVGTWDKERLEACQIAQGDSPSLTELQIDAGSLYVVQERHRYLVGTQADEHPPRSHTVQTISLPLGEGPYFAHSCAGQGYCAAPFFYGELAARAPQPHEAPCWRHVRYPLHIVAQVVDAAAGVQVSAAAPWTMGHEEVVPGRMEMGVVCAPEADAAMMWIDAGGGEVRGVEVVTMEHGLFGRLMGRGRICGDERWIVGDDAEGNVVVCRFD